MGADLCGYIMFGPKKITAKAKKEAVKFAAELVKKGDKKRGVLTKQGPRRYITIQLGSGEEDVFSDLDEIKGLINDFVKMWNEGGYRDMMERALPDSKDEKVLVCGERTWGDGPDSDSAWGLSDRVAGLGLLPVLGIR